MNELLLELAEQAEEYASKEYSSRKMGYDRDYYFEKKFAELIVRECARIGELKEQDHEDYDPDISVWWYMMQHFGFEE